MINYIQFDIERFLRDSRTWEGELKELKKELDSITEISGASDNLGHSTDISKPVERIAIDRDRVMSRMGQLKHYIDALDAGMKGLTEHDRELIIGFFFGDRSMFAFVDAWCREHNSNRQYCYRDRRIALDHLRIRIQNYMRIHGYDVQTRY